MSQTHLELAALAQQALDYARAAGASAAEVEVSTSSGLNLTVRKGELEVIEHNRDRGVSITVYIGTQRASASSGDISASALKDAAEKAVTFARYTSPDPAAGLADPARLATVFPDLQNYHPSDVAVEALIERARRMEAAAFAADRRVDNSDGASISTGSGDGVYANTHGFCAGAPWTYFQHSVSVLASDGDEMETAYWYDTNRAFDDLMDPEQVGRLAGQRAASRLGSRRIATQRAPVLFEAQVATGLLGQYVNATSGGALYRKASFLLDSLGQAVFPSWFHLDDDPTILRGFGSSSYDEEGVATQKRRVVNQGVVDGYFLGSYSARKLGMQTTGNAGGSHNIVAPVGHEDLQALLKRMGRGLFVTSLMGDGVNLVTGDYSRGASGFWVEGGEIAYPVSEITIASNLRDMFKGLVAVGSDVDRRGARHVGSVLLDEMMIAGA